MKITAICLYQIENTLRHPFRNALITVDVRKTIIVEVQDEKGNTGYGEVVTFAAPWYTSETTDGAWAILTSWVLPVVLGQTYMHPKQFGTQFSFIKGNAMALAGVETALWDLFAKRQALPLYQVLGGVRDSVSVGIAIGQFPFEETCRRVSEALALEYSRIKLKVDAKNAVEMLTNLCTVFPQAPFMVDFNGNCTDKESAMLKDLDRLQLLMIEQPFHEDAFHLYEQLQCEMRTPICLDESISTLNDLEQMVRFQRGRIGVIKLGRVGGYTKALQLHQYAVDNQIPLWVGGMLESGIGRAHNLALATLPGFTIAGDISASDNYYRRDVLCEKMVVSEGAIKLPEQAGIGFTVDHAWLEQLAVKRYEQVYLDGN